MQIRQGDIFLEAVTAPEFERFGEIEEHDPRGIVLAHGEATGHAHVVIGDGVRLVEGVAVHSVAHPHPGAWEVPVGRFLIVDHPAVLRHDEHAPIPIPPGTYRVTRQREYLPRQRWTHVCD